MEKKDRSKKYDLMDIQAFLIKVKMAIECPEYGNVSFSDLTKFHKLGQGNTRYALEAGGFIQIAGKGFKKWQWIGEQTITFETANIFLDFMRDYNKSIKSRKILKSPPRTKNPQNFIEITSEVKNKFPKLFKIIQKLKKDIENVINEFLRMGNGKI